MNKSIIINSIADSPRTWDTQDKETGESKTLYYWGVTTNQAGEWEIMAFNNKKPFIKLGEPIDVTYKEGKKAFIITKIGAGGRPQRSGWKSYEKSPEEQLRISKQICAEIAIGVYKGRIDNNPELFIKNVSDLAELLTPWLHKMSPNQSEGFMASNALRRGLEIYIELNDDLHTPEQAYGKIIKAANSWLNYYHNEKTFYQSIFNKGNSGSTPQREAVVDRKSVV